MSSETQVNISRLDLLTHASDIVAAYVSNNAISAADLPALLTQVHQKLGELAQDEVVAPKPEPAVPIKKSVTDHYIICLEDGAKLKMLKRYLRTRYNLTPDQYRKRWGLPADYPMVAPEYARRRSDFAKKIGLGKSAS
ncbi:MAG: Ros/MucR family transcriptional regulator [Henriciella sp.]|nr:MucR family transcriptional regulator [Hyphomonadaceae bacterium]